ncbi:MAG: hypothetical protein OJJ21_03235 [Ferrovibrio sp.]|uniref:hypothetical protein n=1 Tax=Ferrovibrio sp. TaxID=1917215 RepID=UPI002619AD31|nr:hypothetical protein [Ferrovibrio sp.]MCW0232592.1 hypothetical protein [Ferrovibrio sp.]
MTTSLEAFTLRPVDLTSPNWSTSTHKSRCTVFARDEPSARRIASNEFCIAVARTMGRPLPTSPWLDEDEVFCTIANIPGGISPDMEGIVVVPD